MSVEDRLARHGHVSFLRIPAIDPTKSAAFYQAVFGWHVEPRNRGEYSFDIRDGAMIGRWATDLAIATEPGMLPYIYVDRIDEVVERVVKQGGQVIQSPVLEGDTRVGKIQDPAGNVLGIWQDASR
jgi:uncharacterized protein